MSQQLICDACGDPIDQDQPHYAVTGVKQQMVEGTLTVVEQAVTVDFHEDHLPWNLPTVPVVPPPASPDVPVGPADPETPPEEEATPK